MKGLTLKGLNLGAPLSGAKKISICLLTIFLLSIFSFSAAVSNDDTGNSISPTLSRQICVGAVSGARELGLFVLGIGWEAVRIVLPEACPEKDKDIDELIRSIREVKSES